MLRRAALAALLFVPALSMIAATEPALCEESAMRRETVTITGPFGRHEISAEIADDDAKRATGLMFRTSLGESEGMLFIYPSVQPVSMWMRNTLIPLDMLFIEAGGRIRRIAQRAEPLSEDTIPSGGPVVAVLELSGGTAARLGLKPGDRVESPLIPP